MTVKKCCDTCEWNFGDICASYGSELGYGGIIDDYKKIREECWQIGLDAFIKEEQKKKNK